MTWDEFLSYALLFPLTDSVTLSAYDVALLLCAIGDLGGFFTFQTDEQRQQFEDILAGLNEQLGNI